MTGVLIQSRPSGAEMGTPRKRREPGEDGAGPTSRGASGATRHWKRRGGLRAPAVCRLPGGREVPRGRGGSGDHGGHNALGGYRGGGQRWGGASRPHTASPRLYPPLFPPGPKGPAAATPEALRRAGVS